MARILIVEDDPASRDYLRTVLVHAHHTTLEAGDGDEAFEVALRELPDLTLTDILLPTTDGFEFVRRLRTEKSTAGLRVIFVSATYHQNDARALATACGVKYILEKPCEPELIINTVGAALNEPAVRAGIPHPEVFEQEHIRLVSEKQSIATRFGAANQRLSELIDLVRTLVSETDSTTLFSVFIHKAREIVGARYGVLALFDADHSHLTGWYVSGLSGQHRIDPAFQSAIQSLFPRFSADCRVMTFSDSELDTMRASLPESYRRSRTIMASLVGTKQKTYGLLALIDKLAVEQFSEEDERVMATLSGQLAVAHENLDRYVQIQQHAQDLEREITERRKAEQALAEINANYSSIINGAPYGILRADSAGKLLMVNPSFARMFGYDTLEDMSHLTVPDLYRDPLERRQHISRYQTNLDVTIKSAETVWKHKDGTPVDVRLSGRRFHTSNDQSMVAEIFVENITEQKLLEREFRQAQKMEAVGQLAAGVAHDFNNLLMVMNSFAQLAAENAGNADKVIQYTGQIKDAVARAALVTRQLLAFSRKQVQQLLVQDINVIVQDLIKMLPPLLGEDVEISAFSKSSDCFVCVDLNQIEQVIINLAVNARDAMPKGGKLTIETASTDLDEDYGREQGVRIPPGRYVTLSVSDSGCGMSLETRNRIFEPFFTTKEVGKGTGLGLAMVYGIVKQSQGYIWVYSELGIGTTFRIYLPRVESDRDMAHRPVVSEVQMVGGKETILVVEDEPALREAICELFRLKGYEVLEARTGKEAITICQARRNGGTAVHALLTDLVMPGMTGVDLVKSVLDILPDIKVIYMSGYSEHAVNAELFGSDPIFLEKPVDFSTLVSQVRVVLDRRLQ